MFWPCCLFKKRNTLESSLLLCITLCPSGKMSANKVIDNKINGLGRRALGGSKKKKKKKKKKKYYKRKQRAKSGPLVLLL
jgi:hypothetical protein